MGYYTEFSLHSVSGGNVDRADVEFAIEAEYGYPGLLGGEGQKWYSFDDDMQRVSSNFPGTLIVIEGCGEEYPDLWRAYCKDGVVIKVNANITYSDPFDSPTRQIMTENGSYLDAKMEYGDTYARIRGIHHRPYCLGLVGYIYLTDLEIYSPGGNMPHVTNQPEILEVFIDADGNAHMKCDDDATVVIGRINGPAPKREDR